MSSPTWTPAALWSERRTLSGICWRVVEAQHKVSTLKLVDSLGEQELLENLIEQVKPPIPPECRHLHYLLATPFRYGAPYPRGSRFRRTGLTPGVYYAAASPATAIAETAFYRLLFFAESPKTPWPANAGEFTAFSVRHATAIGLDLTAHPLVADRSVWTHLTNYEPCQVLADAARSAGYRNAEIRVRARSQPRHELCDSDLQGLCERRAGRSSDLADSARSERRTGGVRVSRCEAGVCVRCIRR